MEPSQRPLSCARPPGRRRFGARQRVLRRGRVRAGRVADDAAGRDGPAGDRKARLARRAIQSLDRYISATQLGITLASLGLGWIGEPALARLLEGWLRVAARPLASDRHARRRDRPSPSSSSPASTSSLASWCPKAFALVHPETVAAWVAGPADRLRLGDGDPDRVPQRHRELAAEPLRHQPARRAERLHSPEEIRMLVEQSEEGGSLLKQDARLLEGVFEFSEKTAQEVMTPAHADGRASTPISRSRQAADEVARGPALALPGLHRVARRDRRRGARQGHPHRRAVQAGTRRVRAIMRPPLFVPGTREVEDVLADMKRLKAHLAVVLDEYGGTAGLVTMEDLLEEIVGPDLRRVRPAGRVARAATPGGTRARRRAADHRVQLEYDAALDDTDYTTLGGYLFGQLGRLPRAGRPGGGRAAHVRDPGDGRPAGESHPAAPGQARGSGKALARKLQTTEAPRHRASAEKRTCDFLRTCCRVVAALSVSCDDRSRFTVPPLRPSPITATPPGALDLTGAAVGRRRALQRATMQTSSSARATRSCSRRPSSTRRSSVRAGGPGVAEQPDPLSRIATGASSRSATTSLPASRGGGDHVRRAPRPLRLCYSGTSFVRSPSGGAPRETLQVGAELLGQGDLAADVEIVRLTLALAKARRASAISSSISATPACSPPASPRWTRRCAADVRRWIDRKDRGNLSRALGEAGGDARTLHDAPVRDRPSRGAGARARASRRRPRARSLEHLLALDTALTERGARPRRVRPGRGARARLLHRHPLRAVRGRRRAGGGRGRTLRRADGAIRPADAGGRRVHRPRYDRRGGGLTRLRVALAKGRLYEPSVERFRRAGAEPSADAGSPAAHPIERPVDRVSRGQTRRRSRLRRIGRGRPRRHRHRRAAGDGRGRARAPGARLRALPAGGRRPGRTGPTPHCRAESPPGSRPSIRASPNSTSPRRDARSTSSR